MDGLFRRRHLPHWDIDGAPYFITACLAGSIPAAGMRELVEYRNQLQLQPRPDTVAPAEWERRQHKLWFARMDEMLDHEPAVRHFARPELAEIVRRSLAHFENARYVTLAWVIMPSHLHWLFQPLPAWSQTIPRGRTPREAIMHSLKSFTAHECNHVLGVRGEFWQQESYDHWIRDDAELERVIAYILHNPVRAGLATSSDQYRFSSAYVG
jgi:putative transposase